MSYISSNGKKKMCMIDWEEYVTNMSQNVRKYYQEFNCRF